MRARGRVREIALSLGLLAASVTCSGVALALPSVQYFVFLDTDISPVTGCEVMGPGGLTFAGAEVRLTISVFYGDAPAMVTGITRAVCMDGHFGREEPISPGSWPVGLGNGVDGSNVIEAFVDLAALGNPMAVRVGVLSGEGELRDALFTTNGEGSGPPMILRLVTPVPAAGVFGLAGCVLVLTGLALWGLRRRGLRIQAGILVLGFTAVAGVAWAARFVADGAVADWANVRPLGRQVPCGYPAVSMAAVFAVADGRILQLRIDVVPVRTPFRRYVLNGDGTVKDCQTRLIWEAKSDDGSLHHDVDFGFVWAGRCSETTGRYCQPTAAAAAACASGTGSAATVGCALCPGGEQCECAYDPCVIDPSTPPQDPTGGSVASTIWQWLVWLNSGSGFAGHTDWRIPLVSAPPPGSIPSKAELETILALPCSSTENPCVAEAFNHDCVPGCTVDSCSCTSPAGYLSASTSVASGDKMWFVSFNYGVLGELSKHNDYFVRAVRGP